MRRGGGVGMALDGVVEVDGERGGMVIMDGLTFWTRVKECVMSVVVLISASESTGVKIMGATFFGDAFMGESERGT